MTVKEDEFGEVMAEARIVKKKTADPAPAAAPVEPTPEVGLVEEAVIEPAAEIPSEAAASEGIEAPIEEPPPKPKPLVRFL
jgi:hypothetical protein